MRDARFQSHFGETLQSNLPEYQVEGPWPLVRLIGENLCIIAVNSSRPNPIPWHSNGKVSEKQLAALHAISQDLRIASRVVVIITHFAPLLASGAHDTRLHGLINADAFLATLSSFSKAIILCGHVHKCYHVIDPKSGHTIFCAGSATMEDKESFWLFDVAGDIIKATPGRWSCKKYVLDKNKVVKLSTQNL